MTRPLAQISDSRANPQFSAGGAVPPISVATIPPQHPDSDAHLLTSDHLAAPESTETDATFATANGVISKAATVDSSAPVTVIVASARSPVSAAGTVKEATRETAVATSDEVTPIASCAAVREPASTPDSELTVEGNCGGSTAESSREEANKANSAARHTGANREAVEASVLFVTVTDVQSAAAVREAELCAEVDGVIESLVIHTVAAVTSAAVTPVVRDAVEPPAFDRSSGLIPVGQSAPSMDLIHTWSTLVNRNRASCCTCQPQRAHRDVCNKGRQHEFSCC